MAPSGLQRRKIEVLLDQVERLPTLPGPARNLLRLLSGDRPNPRELQLALEVDATLAARAVRLARHLGRPADSIRSLDAVLDTVPWDALAADLLSTEIVDAETLREGRLVRLWRHNLAVGMAAQILASRLGTLLPQEALLAGLLHDVGLVALPILMPKAYAQVLDHAASTGADLIEAERLVLGVDHAVLGKRLAQHWGFSQTLQHVIWMHHQAQTAPAERNSTSTLMEVVRLADLIVRQEGFSYHPTEQVRDDLTEAAERLGLSGAGAQQIGHQVTAAFDLNARPTGLEDEPSLEDLWPVVTAANSRLGRLCREGHDRCHRLETQSRRTDLLIRLNARLAQCHSARDVLETVAATACDALGLRVVVPYLLSREGEYVEGVRYTHASQVEDHFLYDLQAREGLEPLPSHEVGPLAAPAGPVRAERIEAWLFERQGASLGPGPFYTIAMMVEQTKVGGIVFALAQAGRDLAPPEMSEIAALASMAGLALKRTQAEGDLVALSEELAEVNRELQTAQEERLQRRNVASLSEMAAGAAHEINNPLAIISGRAQQLAATEEDPDRREALRTVIQQAVRISGIITELRLFAQPPAPNPQTADPAVLARRVARDLEPLAGQAAVRLHVDAPAGLPPIRVDLDQVASALTEVVRNAVEACAPVGGGHVTFTVQASPTQQTVRFVVADNGPGMPPHVRARAFDPFYSGYEAGRHRGLGLPKAYQTVQANGGQMVLESTPGLGTNVRMTFPSGETEAKV